MSDPSVVFAERFKPFIEASPICVMARCVLENIFNPKQIDAIFERTAKKQYTRELPFSAVVDLMGQVVMNVKPSVHAAWQAQAQRIGVSDQAVYDKLNHIEPEVSAELVRDSARSACTLIKALKAALPQVLPGYRVRILDGNHLAATQRRIKELRTIWDAPLPGQILVVLDPELMLVPDVILCQDGHAQERSMLGEVLQIVKEGELWIADRNFCTFDFLCGIEERKAAYLIRQHGQTRGELLGKAVARGRTATGKVYEQQLRLIDANGHVHMTRRITVRLHKPTRDGDEEIHLLANLPCKIKARQVADLYAKRWGIEIMFNELTSTLTCEINTLGYPKAQLFGFCLALMAYHAVSVIKAALRSVHGQKTVEQNISGYYLSLEISGTYQGMMVAISPEHWTKFRGLPAAEMAEVLRHLAAYMVLSRYQKHPRGPKKPPPAKSKYRNGGHVATARLIDGRMT
jgi:hypothetical protein